MTLYLVRFTFEANDTGGILFVNGKPEAFTLEDEEREEKVYGKTCIPEGEYELGLRMEGGFHQRYTERFADDSDINHVGMIQILNVPDFEYILFHCGNDDDDTAGCVLVGEMMRIKVDTEYPLQDSKKAYKRIYNQIAPALKAGEVVNLIITKSVPQ